METDWIFELNFWDNLCLVWYLKYLFLPHCLWLKTYINHFCDLFSCLVSMNLKWYATALYKPTSRPLQEYKSSHSPDVSFVTIPTGSWVFIILQPLLSSSSSFLFHHLLHYYSQQHLSNRYRHRNSLLISGIGVLNFLFCLCFFLLFPANWWKTGI